MLIIESIFGKKIPVTRIKIRTIIFDRLLSQIYVFASFINYIKGIRMYNNTNARFNCHQIKYSNILIYFQTIVFYFDF